MKLRQAIIKKVISKLVSLGNENIDVAKDILEAIPKNSMEYVVCAAIKLVDGTIVCGPTHNDGIMLSQLSHIKTSKENTITGFVTNRGNFLNREEAYKLAKLTGQLKKKQKFFEDKKLYSQDLY